jgi:ABC-type transporter Mla MlaB component
MRAITKGATDRKRHDTFAALLVDLDGTLDRLKALELINQIKEAVNQARKDACEVSLEGFSFAGLKHLNEDLKNA